MVCFKSDIFYINVIVRCICFFSACTMCDLALDVLVIEYSAYPPQCLDVLFCWFAANMLQMYSGLIQL